MSIFKKIIIKIKSFFKSDEELLQEKKTALLSMIKQNIDMLQNVEVDEIDLQNIEEACELLEITVEDHYE